MRLFPPDVPFMEKQDRWKKYHIPLIVSNPKKAKKEKIQPIQMFGRITRSPNYMKSLARISNP